MPKTTDSYDRHYHATSPEHAKRFADSISSGDDVQVFVEGARVRIITTIAPGESYSRSDADDYLKERMSDTFWPEGSFR